MFKKSIKIIFVVLISMANIIFLSPSARGSGFPQKPVKIVVGSAAGGGVDAEVRGIVPYLKKYLGVSVITENQPGAGGKIAFEKLMKQKPDGYSLMADTFPRGIIIEHMEKVDFRVKDYTPVFAWSLTNQLLVVNADTWKTTADFLKAAKVRTLSGGLSGRGSTSHLTGLIAMDALGIKVNWVPYEGSGESLPALAGKHLDFTIAVVTSALPLIKAGRLRPLLLFGEERDSYLPDVPVPKDLGYNMTLIMPIRGVYASPKTPPAIVKVWEEAFSKTVKDAEFLEWAKRRQILIRPLNAKEFDKVTRETYLTVEKFQQLLKL